MTRKTVVSLEAKKDWGIETHPPVEGPIKPITLGKITCG